jgi:hypothetical protein
MSTDQRFPFKTFAAVSLAMFIVPVTLLQASKNVRAAPAPAAPFATIDAGEFGNIHIAPKAAWLKDSAEMLHVQIFFEKATAFSVWTFDCKKTGRVFTPSEDGPSLHDFDDPDLVGRKAWDAVCDHAKKNSRGALL